MQTLIPHLYSARLDPSPGLHSCMSTAGPDLQAFAQDLGWSDRCQVLHTTSLGSDPEAGFVPVQPRSQLGQKLLLILIFAGQHPFHQQLAVSWRELGHLDDPVATPTGICHKLPRVSPAWSVPWPAVTVEKTPPCRIMVSLPLAAPAARLTAGICASAESALPSAGTCIPGTRAQQIQLRQWFTGTLSSRVTTCTCIRYAALCPDMQCNNLHGESATIREHPQRSRKSDEASSRRSYRE